MWRSPEPRYDVASAIAQGGRSYQEDALVTDFPFGMDSGVAVLADGMGGHAAGDVASKIVVTEVYSELKFQSANFADHEAEIPDFMRAAVTTANGCVHDHVSGNPGTRGMGATLVSLVMVENRLFWMSIGDSPLYVLRDGKLRQLNEDHSLAPQIDFMAEQGLITPEAAADHPDRNCLTSVILGGQIARSDCPATPFEVKMGDVVVVSSDGLQYLENERIQKLLHKYRRRKSAEIAGRLLEALDDLADPDQDNISFAVIKLNHMKPVERKIVAKPTDFVEDDRLPTTRLAVLPDAGAREPGPKEDAAKAPAMPAMQVPPSLGAAKLAAPDAEDAPADGPEMEEQSYTYRGQTYTRMVPKTAEAEAKAEAEDAPPPAIAGLQTPPLGTAAKAGPEAPPPDPDPDPGPDPETAEAAPDGDAAGNGDGAASADDGAPDAPSGPNGSNGPKRLASAAMPAAPDPKPSGLGDAPSGAADAPEDGEAPEDDAAAPPARRAAGG